MFFYELNPFACYVMAMKTALRISTAHKRGRLVDYLNIIDLAALRILSSVTGAISIISPCILRKPAMPIPN